MAQFEKLFEPGYIKKLKVKNKASISPMERNYGDRNGNPTQVYIDYLVERAKNGVGMITVESTFVDPAGRGNIYQIGLHNDSVIPNHKMLTESVHKFGTVIATELHHAGRNAATWKSGFQPVAPSPVPCMLVGGDMPRELTVAEINEIINKYAEGARRAKKAGYDMVTIHGAHGYLISAFTSPFTNKRTDEYGGSPEKRWRFCIEVYEAVRAAVGDDMPIGYRISADEFVDGGLTLDETKPLAKRLEELGLDYLDCSAGIYESAYMAVQPMDMEIGCLVPLSASIKEVVDIPVIVAGRINDPVFAEKILERNEADFIHMGRAFHADPEFLVKAQKGDMDDICMCVACNKCADFAFGQVRVGCTVNPAAGREREFRLKPTKSKKKVMVIGGGLSGMEAARIAAVRGHEVSLFEKEKELGGSVRWCSKGSFREEWFQTARYRIHALKAGGVKINTGHEVVLADVNEIKPDVVIIATGTIPFVPPYIPGVDNHIVTTHVDVLLGKKPVGRKAVIIGGKDDGVITAEFLSENGCRAIIVEPSDALAPDLPALRSMVVLPRINDDPNIEVKLKTNVESIGGGWVEIQSQGKTERITDLDMVVFAWGKDMVRQLADDIALNDMVPEVYLIGDAAWPRETFEVILEGAVTGRMI